MFYYKIKFDLNAVKETVKLGILQKVIGKEFLFLFSMSNLGRCGTLMKLDENSCRNLMSFSVYKLG